MISTLERPEAKPAGLHDIAQALDGHIISNAVVAALFACTGPLAILLLVATKAGLSIAETNAWILGAYGIGGSITLAMSVLYKQPLVFAFTTPGMVLMATAFDSLSLPEAVGAYLVVGFLIIVLGLTGFVSHLTRLCPLPIVFGMVAGVFLPISVNVVTGFSQQPVVSLVTVAGFVIVSAMPRYGRVLPPVLASLLFGGIVIGLTGRFSPTVIPPGIFALPVVVKPDFNWIGVAELAAPLVISVVVIQNMQGFAILRSVGHKPPVNAMTLMCGLGSIPMAFLGSVPTCVTGPAAGIIVGSAPVKRHFASAIVFGIILIVFGLAAPAMTWLAAGLPPTFIATVGGLALLPVLQQAFRATFSGPLALGGLVAFLVTVAGQPILNIGAPFWGLFFGILVAWLLEYKEMRAAISPTQGVSAS